MVLLPPQPEDDGRPLMVQLASFVLPSTSARIKAHTLRYCPTMDLIAAALEDESWGVWRLSGGRVFGGSGFIKEGQPKTMSSARVGISRMEWKSLGMLLAIACTDNSLRLVSTYTGKVVHVLTTAPATTDARISCLGWNINLTDPVSVTSQIGKSKANDAVDQMLGTASTGGQAALNADLPRDLALINVEVSFPKLSTLPTTGIDDDVFSSRASLDAMFHEVHPSPTDSVDVLIAGFDSGSLYLRIFESFDIGRVDIGTVFTEGQTKILKHASHSLSPAHALVVEHSSSSGSGSQLYLITMSLRFITASPRYLSSVASRATQIQNLLRYIYQVQNQINLEWKTAQDLPSKFLRNINETLAEKMECDFVTAAYHLVVTGDCYPVLKEFLVDELGERGHKRWEKAVSNGYETIRRLVHECLLPAIERLQVVTSRLKGLAGFRKAGGVLGLKIDALASLDDTMDCLTLLAHKLLLAVGKELRQFTAFAKWLRLEIDIQATDPDVSNLDDLLERQDNIEYRPVLDYIAGAMSESDILQYIRPSANMEAEKDPWSPEDISDGCYKTYKARLRKRKDHRSENEDDLPRLDDLTGYLKRQCDDVFSQIAETLRKSILLSSPILLPEQLNREIFDIKMLSTAQEHNGRHEYRALMVAQQDGGLGFYELLAAAPALGTAHVTRHKSIEADNDYKIVDIKFVDAETIMVLKDNGKEAQIDSWNYDDLNHPSCETKHVFVLSQMKSRPCQLEVNGRKGRRIVCVLFEDRRSYNMFDIDNSVEPEVENEEVQLEDSDVEDEMSED